MTDKIKGYRKLTDHEVKAINAIKQKGVELGILIEEMEASENLDPRWVAIAKTDFQKGLMAAVRSVAKPESF
jgi:molybdate-binding protein